MHPALENICIIDNHHCSITIKLMRVEYVQQKNQILHLPVNKLKLLMGVSDGDRRGQVRYPPGRAGRLTVMANLAMDKGERVNQSFTCEDAGILQ